MSRYIDQDQIAELARHSTIGIDANDIMRFPSIEIVNCEDCKFYKAEGNYCDRDIVKSLLATEPTDFCSWGIRRKSDADIH